MNIENCVLKLVDRMELGWLREIRKWKWLFVSGCEFSGGFLPPKNFCTVAKVGLCWKILIFRYGNRATGNAVVICFDVYGLGNVTL